MRWQIFGTQHHKRELAKLISEGAGDMEIVSPRIQEGPANIANDC
jgi:hypothetical protein